MSRPPIRSRGGRDALSVAEAAFKSATTKPVQAPVAAVAIPGAREQVTLRLDADVLEHFRAAGPGLQDRINAALRRAADL